MSDYQLPDLKFPQVTLGRHETPWNLKSLLYFGCSDLPVREFLDLEIKGQLGEPIFERIELVKSIHNVISVGLISGHSQATAKKRIKEVRRFFAWSERSNLSLSIFAVKDAYINYTDYLLQRVRVVGDLGERTARSYSVVLGGLLDKVLGRRTKIVGMTRISKLTRSSGFYEGRSDKQNLEETFAFGYAIMDVCLSLSLDKVWGIFRLE